MSIKVKASKQAPAMEVLEREFVNGRVVERISNNCYVTKLPSSYVSDEDLFRTDPRFDKPVNPSSDSDSD